MLAEFPVHDRIAHFHMATTSSQDPSDDIPQDLHTAEEIAAYLKVDPKTVLNWAKSGIIPEAFRVGRTVRFSMEAVKASLDVNCAGGGRRFELVVLALKTALGDDFHRYPRLDFGSITLDETDEVKRLSEGYTKALEGITSFQERNAFAEGTLDAWEILIRGEEAPTTGSDHEKSNIP